MLFPAARRALEQAGEKITSDVETQHQRINELLLELEAYEPGDLEFEHRVAELFPLLRLDVRNEEDRLLASLEGSLDEGALERLGAEWLAAKKLAPDRPHPAIPRRPPGNVVAGLPLAIIDRVRRFFTRS